MIDILLFFIAASVLLYVVLGGADYGAGILELLPSGGLKEKERNVINHAMGPVWEANHMWLVLVIVILFMGFPKIYTTIMTSLHIPVVALLVGIVIRGAAFTFRHYDALYEETPQNVYSWLFSLSSLWSALWIGIIAGSIDRGTITIIGQSATPDFMEAYIYSWWGYLPLATGIMTVFIFGFLASIYLVGETDDDQLKKLFWRRGFYFNVGIVGSGALVFAASYIEKTGFLSRFIQNPISLATIALASILFLVLWYFARRNQSRLVRFIAAIQVSLILLGWYLSIKPLAIMTTTGPLTFESAASPAATLWQLTIALVVGSCLIFPSLFYLLKVFKSDNK